ncbi:hypothetical protein BS47DRAFT_1369528 [Hydnum rufescens UP504]|uniref:Uncharacterized protein n=1 Tax=Hydnum rufescens UP504 TaxID=1448309 RepID=A0A9P6ACY3_9AGAM|nr:hypothetical protein BS47DRAFT_1369528 [Hydnum rufescens UP504]
MTTNPPNESHKHDPPQNISQMKPKNGNPQHKTARTLDEPHTCFSSFSSEPMAPPNKHVRTAAHPPNKPPAQMMNRPHMHNQGQGQMCDCGRKQVHHTHFSGCGTTSIILDSKPELLK